MIPARVTDDAEARRAALDPERSFIVQAPAGSGKTELLIQRFLVLLARVDEPEEIVSITFTRKAASEMRERVMNALTAALEGEPVTSQHGRLTRELAEAALENDRRRGWSLAEHPSRLRIETIDALAAGLTRAMPWLSRFGAMPQPVEDAYPLYRAAAHRTLRILGEGSADSQMIRHLLEHLDNNVSLTESLIAEMLSRREQWLRLVFQAQDIHSLRPHFEQQLERAIEHELGRLHKLAPRILHEHLPGLLKKPFPQTLTQCREAAELLMVKAGTWRKRVPPEAKHAERVFHLIQDRLQREEHEPFREALRRGRDLPNPVYLDSQWDVLATLFRILKIAAANLRAVFQTRGQVDFTEIVFGALDALGSEEAPADLALNVGSRISHLLVDEFQDTSEMQQMLLKRLIAAWSSEEPHTLFLVGDPMQSIYRFRQAEVGLFLDIRSQGLGQLALDALRLTANFRSSEDVVTWVNSRFEKILPDEEDASTGAVPFASSTPFRTEQSLPVTLQVYSEANDLAEARLVADLVESGRDKGRIAVLVRARPHLRSITAEFDRRGWKYRAVQVATLAESLIVRDLLALTRALVHLADRPAWLSILRAPWCGLSLGDLYAIAGADQVSAIWTLLHSPALALSEDGAMRLAKCKAALEPVLAQRRRVNLRSWVEAAWIRLGGPACAATELEREDASEFLDLLDEFAEGGDLPEFDRMEHRLRDLFTKPDPEAGEELQVMTIHQAKGLEFETVILPGLGKPPKRDETRLLMWSTHNQKILLAPMAPVKGEPDPVYKFLERHERTKDKHESSRLLYVAATRAKERLHLIGHARQTKDGPRPASGSLLEKLWSFVTPSSMLDPGTLAPPRAHALEVRRLPISWTAPAVRDSVQWSPARRVAESPEVTFEWAGNTLRHVGVVVHRYIQRIAKEGLANWNESTVRDQRHAIKAALSSLGVPPSDLAMASARVEQAITGTLEDGKGRWTLQAHTQARSELAMTAVFDSWPIHVAIDRTFIEDGVRWIIDYKTSSHEGTGVEAFLGNEVERYRAQLETYARVLKLEDPKIPIRLGLYFPLLKAWREVDF